MNQTIKDRIILWVEFQNISISAFERKCGLGVGYVANLKANTNSKKINDIIKAYPELNKQWLLTGEGDMLKKINNQNQSAGNDSVLQQANGDDITQSANEKESKTLTQAMSEISEMRKALTKAMDENQQNTLRLLDIVDRLIDK